MNKTSSQGKAHMAPVAVVAGLGMAGMGLVSSGVVAATDITSVTDTLNVEVSLSCTFNSVTNKTYTGSADNGAEVENFNDAGVHEFSLFCNGSNGYTVTATPYDLEATGISEVISYTDNYTPSGVDGLWTAAITSDASGVTVTPVVPVGGGTIISSDSGTEAAGVSFTATYEAYVGTGTPAGTYTGTIVYTLTASEASNNSGNSGNNNDSGSGTDSGNEVTDNTDNNGGSGTGGSSNANSNSVPNNAPKTSPTTLNNTYNTYNTTNYANGGGNGTTGTQLAMNGNTNDVTDGTANEDDDSNSESSLNASDGYEEPLGVTTGDKSSSNEDSEMDWMPIVAVGALAVAGVATAALVKSGKKEEE